MYETIEAIYDDGRIIPLKDELPAKRAKVFLTILEELEEDEPQGMPLETLSQLKGALKKFPDGLVYQQELRDEW